MKKFVRQRHDRETMCADFLLATTSTYMKNAVATMRFQIQKIVMVGLTTLTTS